MGLAVWRIPGGPIHAAASHRKTPSERCVPARNCGLAAQTLRRWVGGIIYTRARPALHHIVFLPVHRQRAEGENAKMQHGVQESVEKHYVVQGRTSSGIYD